MSKNEHCSDDMDSNGGSKANADRSEDLGEERKSEQLEEKTHR